MAAMGFAFLLCMTMSVTIGSESVAGNPEKVRQLEDRISSLEASIPQTLQLETDQVLITVLDEVEIKFENFARTNNVSEMGEVLRKELQTLLSNHTFRMEDEMRNQTLLINKLSSQLVDVQSVLTCTGEPPSQQNGRTVDFERKHGSVVLYRCDRNFVLGENSTVRCHLGKWEGRPPLCTRPAPSLRVHVDKNSWVAINVSCWAEESGQPVRFTRILDTGTGGALPTDARTFTRDGVAVLDLSRVPDEDLLGVFQCGHVNRTGRTFVIDRNGYFVRPKVASVGDYVTLGILFDDPPIRWLHDGQRVPAWDGRGRVKINGVGKQDAGVYEQYREGDRRDTQNFFRLVVRGCPAGSFGQRCQGKCPNCQNGGLCDEKLGTCVCPVGLRGLQCEEASEACDGGDCSWQLFCLPDPYGCSCAAGYWGYHCDEIGN